MPCTNPKPAWQPISGGKLLLKKPDPKTQKHGYEEIRINCQECYSCRLRHAIDWANRQHCEAHTTEGIGRNYFVTNTYDEENIPEFHHYDYFDMQAMHKRLRSRLAYEAKKRGIPQDKVRYKFVTAPEYGDKTLRPHFHTNFFNLWLPDVEIGGTNQEGRKYLRSKILEESWNKGFLDIQTFGIGSARYLANHNIKQNGSSLKKSLQAFHWVKREGLKAQQKTEHPFDPVTGQLMPEKMPMPRVYCSQGIGLEYFNRYHEEIYRNGTVRINGIRNPIPRYFDLKLKQRDPEKWEEIRAKRIEEAHEWTDEELKNLNEMRLHRRQFFAKAGQI